MNHYEDLERLNQEALVNASKALDERWQTECDRAARAGTFPHGVRLHLDNPPPTGRVEKWSDQKYEVYVHHFEGLEAEHRYYEDAVPESWNVHLRERKPVVESVPAPREGPISASFRSLFNWRPFSHK